MFLVFMLLVLSEPDITLKEVRSELFYNEFTDTQIEPLYERLHDIRRPSPIMQGYEGLLTSMMAQIEKSPRQKLRRLSSGRKMIAEAIEDDPSNAEIIFTRFILETRIPSWLRSSDNLKTDKENLYSFTRNLSSSGLDAEMSKVILRIMIESKIYNQQEVETLTITLKKLES